MANSAVLTAPVNTGVNSGVLTGLVKKTKKQEPTTPAQPYTGNLSPAIDPNLVQLRNMQTMVGGMSPMGMMNNLFGALPGVMAGGGLMGNMMGSIPGNVNMANNLVGAIPTMLAPGIAGNTMMSAMAGMMPQVFPGMQAPTQAPGQVPVEQQASQTVSAPPATTMPTQAQGAQVRQNGSQFIQGRTQGADPAANPQAGQASMFQQQFTKLFGPERLEHMMNAIATLRQVRGGLSGATAALGAYNGNGPTG